MAGIGPELVFSVRQAVGFELDLTAFRVSAHQDEIAVVGDQDLVVAVPVFGDLRAIGGEPGVLGSGLDFDYAARRDAGAGGFGAALGKLIGGEEAAIGIARAAVLQLEDAADPGFEGLADIIEQVYNPVSAGLAASPCEWRWSSARLAGESACPTLG